METESLDDQEVSNLATMSNSLNITGGTGKGRKHSFFQVSSELLKLFIEFTDSLTLEIGINFVFGMSTT